MARVHRRRALLQDAERAVDHARAAYQQATAQVTANSRAAPEAAASEACVREAQGALQIIRAKLSKAVSSLPPMAASSSGNVENGDVAQPARSC